MSNKSNMITHAPWSYLIPADDAECILFYVFEKNGKTGQLTPDDIESICSSDDPNCDVSNFSSAGQVGLADLDAFAETYDAGKYRENEQYLQTQCIDAILAIPALCGALMQFKGVLPQLQSAYSAGQDADAFYALLETTELKSLFELLSVLRKSMVLPKLPMEITTASIGDGDWEFTVTQHYGKESLVVFRSSSCYSEQPELLLGFLLYDAFASLLPKTLLRFEDQVDGVVLFNSLQDCSEAFSAVGSKYADLISVMDESEEDDYEE